MGSDVVVEVSSGVLVAGALVAGAADDVLESAASAEHAARPRMASDDTAKPTAIRDFMGVPFVRFDRGHGHLEHDTEPPGVHRIDEDGPTVGGQPVSERARMGSPPADRT